MGGYRRPMTMTGFSTKERLAIGLIAAASAAAGATHYLHATPFAAFGAATVALAGLAWVVGFATEQIGEQLSPAVTGVLQSTVGNLPEFFVVIFALRAGETVVAQTSIVGSLLANALLVLGLSIFVGARASEDGVMRFSPRLPNDTATLLLIAVFLMTIIGISVHTSDKASHHVVAVSVVGAVCLLVVYVAWLVPYLRSGAASQPGHGTPRVSAKLAAAMLALAGVGAAFVSEWFVAALTPTIDKLNISAAFAGLVIVAIAGNAVENSAAVMLAAKGKSDLAISVVKSSVSQIAVFVFPALVLVSLLFATPLTFALSPVLIAAIALTAVIVWQITGDGEAPAFEGLGLVCIFVILATLVFFE
jgi:Ca2+:H+ antiporter